MKRRSFLALLGLAPVVPLVAKGPAKEMVEEKAVVDLGGEWTTITITDPRWITAGDCRVTTYTIVDADKCIEWTKGGDARLTLIDD